MDQTNVSYIAYRDSRFAICLKKAGGYNEKA